MKKVKRVFFCVFLICFIALCCYLLYREFYTQNIILKIEKDPSLIILILLTCFAVLSLLFNINKFDEFINLNTTLYKTLRIGDLIFSIFLVLSICVGYYFIITDLNNIYASTFLFYSKIIIIVAIQIVGFLLIIDNFKFHKNQKKTIEKDYIQEIGR